MNHGAIWQRAWPIILANAAVPLLGLADTAVIGNLGSLPQLGAIAFGAMIFSFIYWSFGFLRMGTTGFIAQAAGAGDEAEVRATLGRAMLLSAGLGVAIVL
ncbi:MAG: MATE family efflux transporter, partial [Gammaproteobacteria bacterium]|nr:MATE family efflux transporter [Gammaproteobacteria bacterium]